jgi:hypothetical protein
MTAKEFQKRVTRDEADLLQEFLRTLESAKIDYCVIGGQGVNAYAEPLVSLDLDVVVVAQRVDELEFLLREQFAVDRVSSILAVRATNSDLRIQIQLDPLYQPFLSRKTRREVLGTPMNVAAVEDVLQGKIWAYQDSTRRASKRQKDLLDIARLIETHPKLAAKVPKEIRDKIP